MDRLNNPDGTMTISGDETPEDRRAKLILLVHGHLQDLLADSHELFIGRDGTRPDGGSDDPAMHLYRHVVAARDAAGQLRAELLENDRL